MKRLLFLVLFLLALCVSVNGSSFTQKPVQLVWFYKPPPADKLDLVAHRFSWFILTSNDENVRDDLKAKGVQGPFLQYLRFDAIQDPGSCNSMPRQNQVAYQRGDFCEISKDHPDWFLRDDRGNMLRQDNYFLMDPGNIGWQRFFLERAQQMQEVLKWDGVFLDNVEGSMAKRNQKGMPAKYPNEQSYAEAIGSFLSFLYQSYFQPNNRPLLANIISMKNPQVWFKYMNYLDGAMMEAFAVDWHEKYRQAEEWDKQLNLAEETQDRGKMIILVAQGDQHDEMRQQFAFASYLLVTRGRSAFRYTASDRYSQPWMYNDYDLDTGRALGPRFRKADGTWERDFEKVIVRVNPANHRSDIILK